MIYLVIKVADTQTGDEIICYYENIDQAQRRQAEEQNNMRSGYVYIQAVNKG